MVGPFEVESALMEHPAVAEAGVIGKTDPLIGELVKAFVSLKAHAQPSEALRLELLGFARQRLGQIAPEADLTHLAPDADLRQALDIDSFDHLNLLIGLNTTLGVDIPEADYGQLTTLTDIVRYLASRV
jgi:acyl carrier protein